MKSNVGLMRLSMLAGALLMLASMPVAAGEADVLAVRATGGSDDMWRFDVTVAHGDTGWDHYADRWDIISPEGKVLGSRVLLHPHEAEQPFTRSLGGVFIPPDVTSVTVRAHDSVHDYGGQELTVPLER